MQFQVVVQIPAVGIDSFDALVELEDELSAALGAEHIVDGHDFGSGEANIFIHTNHPDLVLEVIRTTLGAERMAEIKAAFRRFESEEYTWLHPADQSERFCVL